MLAIKTIPIFSRVPRPVSRLNISCFSLKSGIQKDISKILCASSNLNQHEIQQQKPDFKPRTRTLFTLHEPNTKSQNIKTLQTRTLFTRDGPDFKPLYKKDKVDTKCELIYKYEKTYMYYNMGFTAFAVPSICYSIHDLVQNYDTLKDLTLMHMEMLPHMNGVFCFTMLIYFNKVMRQFMFRIYYDPERDIYIGIHPGWDFLMQKIEFKKEDCDRKIRNPTCGMWQGNIRIKKRRFSITDKHFKYGRHFERIFGFKLGEELIPQEPAHETITEILKASGEKSKKWEENIEKKFNILKKMIKKKQ